MAKNNTPEKPKASKNTWNIFKEVLEREYGSFRGDSFATDCYSSDYIVSRMELSHHLNQPPGSVMVINFNSRGNLICAGSSCGDGKKSHIGLIDWAENELKASVNTEETAKLSDVNFLNASNYEDQSSIVSVYESGNVRCDRLTPTGEIETLQCYQLSIERHKLAICPGTQHELLSASISGKIFNIDLRCDPQETSSSKALAQTVPDGKNVMLQAISHHPLAPQICASYDDYHVRSYDKRKFDRPLHEICPESLKSLKKPAQISDCFYNYDGSEILAIYTDTQIYLFDSENKQPGEFKQSYGQMGYLAGFTNKTSFFGPKSEYVVIGDDGQRIAFNDKVTGKNVGFTALWPHGRFCSVYFDDLKSHPNLPIVAAATAHFSILSPKSIDRSASGESSKKTASTLGSEKNSSESKNSRWRSFFQMRKAK